MHIVCIGQSKLLQSEYKRKALGPVYMVLTSLMVYLDSVNNQILQLQTLKYLICNMEKVFVNKSFINYIFQNMPFQTQFLSGICWYISGANIDKRSGRFFPFTDISSHKAQSTAHNSVITMKKYLAKIVIDEKYDKIQVFPKIKY